MLGEAQTEIPVGNPLRDAWEAYKLTDDYKNTRKWAQEELHVDGSLWAAFVKGWQARAQTTGTLVNDGIVFGPR